MSAIPHPTSIATVSLSGTLPEKLEAAAAAGFDGVEIFARDLLEFAGTADDVRRMATGFGLDIVLYQPFRDFEAMPSDCFVGNMARAELAFDVMEALGTDLILVCSNVQDRAIDDPDRAAADLHRMAEAAARRGLRVGYEALAWGRHVRHWRQAWDIVQRADHPALGLILDSFHTLALGISRGESLADSLHGIEAVPAERLFFVQLADAPRMALDVLSWSRHHRNFPGQGELAVSAFTHAVLQTGYTGPLSLEIFNDVFRVSPARPVARDGLRSLRWVEDHASSQTLRS
jgi:4-hydroxyphenylpyruvate dioxygenase